MLDLHRIKSATDETIAMCVVIDNPESMANFITLVQRATNLWPDAPPEVKEFADLVTNGKVMQKYGKPKGGTIVSRVTDEPRGLHHYKCSCGTTNTVEPMKQGDFICSGCGTYYK